MTQIAVVLLDDLKFIVPDAFLGNGLCTAGGTIWVDFHVEEW